MQKIKVVLLMVVMCASSFFVSVVSGEESSNITSARISVFQQADNIYNKISFGKVQPVSREVFRKAYMGYRNLLDAGKLLDSKKLLSICDFSLSANVKRLWIIDLDSAKLLFNSLVAHGQGTGDEYAENFSNQDNSHQSSIGFYVTDETYMGDNGYSLKLRGMDVGYNDAAYNRAIVIHGADYVCDSYIKCNKRLGRSWGCPAVPAAMSKAIINTIKDRTCFFIYYPSQKFMSQSVWLNRTPKIKNYGFGAIPDLKKAEDKILAEHKAKIELKNEEIAQANAASEKPKQRTYEGVQLGIGS